MNEELRQKPSSSAEFSVQSGSAFWRRQRKSKRLYQQVNGCKTNLPGAGPDYLLEVLHKQTISKKLADISYVQWVKLLTGTDEDILKWQWTMYSCCVTGYWCQVFADFWTNKQHFLYGQFYFVKLFFTPNSNTINCVFQFGCFHLLTDECVNVLLGLCEAHWTKAGGEEQMQRWWWFLRIPYSRCHSSASAGSWRCPRCTWGTGRTGYVFQTGSPGCYREAKHLLDHPLNTHKHTALIPSESFTFERFVPSIQWSTSVWLEGRWSQQRQQELQTQSKR